MIHLGGRRLFVGKLVAVVDRSLGGGLLAVLIQLPGHPQEGVGQLAYQLPMGVRAGRAALQPLDPPMQIPFHETIPPSPHRAS